MENNVLNLGTKFGFYPERLAHNHARYTVQQLIDSEMAEGLWLPSHVRANAASLSERSGSHLTVHRQFAASE